MRAWVAGRQLKYQIPSETLYFQKVAVALHCHEADEAVLDRQRGEWIADLAEMITAQSPASPLDAAVQLPEGARLQIVRQQKDR
jgi:hypothetical protein